MDTVIGRSRWILFAIIGALSLCVVRLVQLQIVEGPTLAAQGQRVRTSSTSVAAARAPLLMRRVSCWPTRSRHTTSPSTR